MKISMDHTQRFVGAMFNIMSMFKASGEDCCEKFGGLNQKEFSIVMFVAQLHDVKMKDIAEHMNAPISTLTSIVDKMIVSNYLTRYHSAEDRRVVMVTLAKNGKALADMCMEKSAEFAAIVLSQYKDAEQEKYIKFLEGIPAQVEKHHVHDKSELLRKS